MLFLAKELGEPIEGAREFGHDQHGLEVVRYLKPGCVAPGEVSRHPIDSDGGVFVVGDFDVHGRFELEVGGDDTGLPILFLKVVPEDTGSVHSFGREIPLDLGGQSEHHVSDGLLVIIFPILDLLSRRWYILHYHRSTLLLPLGELVAGGGGVEERSEVMYWHRGAYIIYYRDITCHSCIA